MLITNNLINLNKCNKFILFSRTNKLRPAEGFKQLKLVSLIGFLSYAKLDSKKNSFTKILTYTIFL